jgi:hypothetical protein
MKSERIIAEVENVEDARKLEETVKTGYAEVSIETLTNWIGVEEDLASSYEQLAAKEKTASRKSMFHQLGQESKSNILNLTEIRRSLEELDKARVMRIEQLASLRP